MKELSDINYEFREGYIPEKLFYCNSINDRRLYEKQFPVGFMNLPNADLIIDKMMFYAKLRKVLEKKLLTI